jgi:hypothetical protein
VSLQKKEEIEKDTIFQALAVFSQLLIRSLILINKIISAP